MRFQPVKCNMMQITMKRIKKIHASYTRSSKTSKVSSILGSLSQMICDGIHMPAIFAVRLIGPLASCAYPQEVKEATYKGLRPAWNIAVLFWDPSSITQQDELEKYLAARVVTGNYNKGLNRKASIPTDYLIPPG